MLTKPKRVLVVDDERLTRDAIAHILRDEGYIVEVANDGDAAIDAFARFVPDLVLTDLHMPERDGIELAKRLRTDHPNVAILLMTAEPPRVIAARAKKWGIVDPLSKPLDIEELVVRVRQALGEPAG